MLACRRSPVWRQLEAQPECSHRSETSNRRAAGSTTGTIDPMSDSTSQDPDDDAVEVIREGDGLVVLGSEAAVEGFLRSLGLWDPARDFRLPNLGTALRAASVVIEAASRVAANSGRYLMVTAETAADMNKLDLIETGTKGVKYAVFGKPGRTEKWLQVMDGPKATLSNPANLTAVSGAMEQFARQAEMREIRAYLASIDRKVDEVITGHHNAEIGKLIGAGLDIESALLVLERQGFVDDDTWSTVQARHHTVTDAIGVAIKDLESVANKLEETAKPSALKDEVANAQARVRDLLAILARASELQVGLDQLRLQRVLDGDPDRIESMRETLREDRERRRAKITDAVDYLLARMDAAAGTAQANAILHRPAQTVIVTSINDLLDAVEGFQRPLGITESRDPFEPVPLRVAARTPAQLKTAGREASRVAVPVLGAIGFATVGKKYIGDLSDFGKS